MVAVAAGTNYCLPLTAAAQISLPLTTQKLLAVRKLLTVVPLHPLVRHFPLNRNLNLNPNPLNQRKPLRNLIALLNYTHLSHVNLECIIRTIKVVATKIRKQKRRKEVIDIGEISVVAVKVGNEND